MKKINSSTLSLIETLVSSQAKLCHMCEQKYNYMGDQTELYNICLEGIYATQKITQQLLGDENEADNNGL